MTVFVGAIVWLTRSDFSQLLLLLPGILALPVFALVPHLGGRCVPLSLPTDAAKSASRTRNMLLIMFVAFALSGLASLSWTQGWFWWLVLGEAMIAGGLYWALRGSIARAIWASTED